MTKPRIALLLLVFTFSFFFSGCSDEKEKPADAMLEFDFQHLVNSLPVVTDSLMYVNAAGNPFEVTEVMYFISDVKLYRSDGVVVDPASWDNIFYIDSNIPSSLHQVIGHAVSPGNYDSLTFVLGISEAQNQSFMYVNPPEVNMAWPEILGGGYHYLMLNGWWKDLSGVRRPYNFHLGIGQIYANNSGQVADITGFVHNAFRVNPGGGPFAIESGKTTTAILSMHIESWFDTPEVFDFNYFGGAIMQNQEAMHMGCLNGADVFRLSWHDPQ